jgi:hypothetical protein
MGSELIEVKAFVIASRETAKPASTRSLPSGPSQDGDVAARTLKNTDIAPNWLGPDLRTSRCPLPLSEQCRYLVPKIVQS